MENIVLIAVEYLLHMAFLAMCNNGLIEYLVVSTFDHYGLDKQPILYISYLSALLICVAFGVNALAALFPQASGPLAWWAGVALTAVPVARGSNYIADKWAPFAGGRGDVLAPYLPPRG